MDLLPKTSEEFTKEEYWNEFFRKRKEVPFEWYGEYLELAELLHKYITIKDKLLIVGCGNSSLGPELFRFGITNQTNIDISPVVINQMKQSYPDVEFRIADVCNLEFEDSTFSVVLDKGTFDALCPAPTKSSNSTENTEEEGHSSDFMLREISRVVGSRGRLLCVSLLQPHVASRLLSHFYSLGWMIRVHRCLDAERKTEERNTENTFVFPVFMIVFTKISLPGGMKPLLEASSMTNNKFTRFNNLDELLLFIKEQQNFAIVKRGLSRSFGDKEISMKLASGTTGDDRYSLCIVDVPQLMKNPVQKRFGIFIVPQGRESEWLFGSSEGRAQLAYQVGFTRLVVVHLMRGQQYHSLEDVQKELNDSLALLAPAIVTEKRIKAPVMTAGNDVGSRDIILEGHSEFSGDFVIEDVTCEGKLLRRLIFLNSPNVIQSEVELKHATKRQKLYKIPLTNTLSCQHHYIMLIGFGMLRHFFNCSEDTPGDVSCLLIGLGGGLLASFLINFMSMLKLTAVEIDSEIVKVANELFGLPKNEDRLQVVVDDGLKFIQSTEKKYNLILLDVDNKSLKEGLSCPPPDFLEASELEKMKHVMDPEKSILVINLVCRNEDLKLNYMQEIAKHFKFMCYYDVPDEVNRVIFCFHEVVNSVSIDELSPLIRKSIESIIKKNANTTTSYKESSGKSKKGKSGESKTKSSCFDGALDDADLISDSFKILTS